MHFLGEVEVTGSVADGVAPVPAGEQALHCVNVDVLDEVHRLIAFWSAVDVKHCLILCSGRSSPNRHRHQTVTIEHMFGWGLLVPLSSYGTKLAEFEQLCSRTPSASRLEGKGKAAPHCGAAAGRASPN